MTRLRSHPRSAAILWVALNILVVVLLIAIGGAHP